MNLKTLTGRKSRGMLGGFLRAPGARTDWADRVKGLGNAAVRQRKPIGLAAGSAATALAGWTAWSYFLSRGIEQPRYRVVARTPDYELREYESYIVAETDEQGDYDDAFDRGFQSLFGYISGGNTKRRLAAEGRPAGSGSSETETIAMAAPVTARQKADREKIPMTSPVSERKTADDVHTVSFVMPSRYSLETLPMPNNVKVRLRKLPGRTVAVRRFSWYATAGRAGEQKNRLLSAVRRDGLNVVSEPEVALYNPPFSVPFLRRNEVIVEVR